MAGNRIELLGRVVRDPEVRLTPRGTVVMRLNVDCASRPGEKLAFSVVMTGDEAGRLSEQIRSGDDVRVTGTLHQVAGRMSSGLSETRFEVVADAIELKK